MDARAVSLLSIFEPKQRIEVPLFQRQYVWNREQQWEPLWDDIRRKFVDFLEGRSATPVHFLGAMVLDQQFTPTGYVVRRQIIDGQQRLTTLQIFLAAFRDFCTEHECPALAAEAERYTFNSGMMADPKVDQFKIWPTALDRSQFVDVMTLGSRKEIDDKHPIVRRKYRRRPEPRPRMVEAYAYFADALTEFYVGDHDDPPIGADQPLCLRLEECFRSLRTALQVVVIDLGATDDPQVIFETLNARGEPLLPADLLRNYIFQRATRSGDNADALYTQYWSDFDDPFWRKEVRQGRLSRPRSDLFMQHFLTSKLSTDIATRHLYVEYKHWIETKRPYNSVEAELADLAVNRAHYQRIVAPTSRDQLLNFSSFLDAFDVSTVYPVMLTILARLPDFQTLQQATTLIESYILRRAVVGLSNKNYNRIFLTLNRELGRTSDVIATIESYLGSLSSDSSIWPSDEDFDRSWLTVSLYHALSASRVSHILRRLSDSYLSGISEHVTISGPLSVEHLMPQSWQSKWLLPDGSTGLTVQELANVDPADPRAIASQLRSQLIHTVGNLTLTTQPLNSRISNNSWDVKRTELVAHSVLPINASLFVNPKWDETSIQARSVDLSHRARVIWPRPTVTPGRRSSL